MFLAQFVPNKDFFHFSLKIKLIILIQIISNSPRRISISSLAKKNNDNNTVLIIRSLSNGYEIRITNRNDEITLLHSLRLENGTFECLLGVHLMPNS